MGDRYFLQLKCAHCGTENPEDYDGFEKAVYYAPSSGFMDFTCYKCGKLNWIASGFHAVKIESKEQLDELYRKNGFVDVDE